MAEVWVGSGYENNVGRRLTLVGRVSIIGLDSTPVPIIGVGDGRRFINQPLALILDSRRKYMALYPVILAGGAGTRLWPLSRLHLPKQFLSLLGGGTMLQETVGRLDGLETENPLIVCNESHRDLALQQMAEIQKGVLSIVLEPEGRNTAPALTLAALFLEGMTEGEPADPVMLVMPGDGVIRDVKEFQAAVKVGSGLAEEGYIVTFGIVPHLAHTGYGYIRKGSPLENHGDTGMGETEPVPLGIRAFVEKPDQPTAESYLKSGDYLWNSSIFMVRSSIWMGELERCRPKIASECVAAYREGVKDGPLFRPHRERFISCLSESIDYAVMERTTESGAPRSAVVPLQGGWSDLGSWAQVWEERDTDADGNVTQGDVYLESVERSLVLAHDRIVAAVGLKDTVVVETKDAVLVANRSQAQEVRKIVERLGDGSATASKHSWGSSREVDKGPGFRVDGVTINPGAVLKRRVSTNGETWVVASGRVKILTESSEQMLDQGESASLLPGKVFRMSNAGADSAELVAVVY